MAAPRPFLIIGQPRSGTTYIQTLLNAHARLHCRGELFDPWQIDDNGEKNTDLAAVQARDANPGQFLRDRLSGTDRPDLRGMRWLGAKVLTQHNFMLFRDIIPTLHDLHVIHVRRANKLAQFASAQQVKASGRWTATEVQPAPRVRCAPSWAAAETNRLANEDFWLSHWLDGLGIPLLRIEYEHVQRPETRRALLDFLGLSRLARLRSPLVKQGQNRIADRFENRAEIEAHFTAIGRANWLSEELD